MPTAPHLYTYFLLAFLLLVTTLPVATADETGQAEPSSATPSREAPSASYLQEKLTALEEATTLNESVRDQAISLYRSALERVSAAEEDIKRTEGFRRAMEVAPKETAQIQQRLSEERAAGAEQAPAQEGLPSSDELRQLLIRKRTEYAKLQSRLSNLEEQIRVQQARPNAIHEELALTRLRREEAERELQSPPSASERLREAHIAAYTAQRHADGSQIDMLEQELLSHEARLSRLVAERDLIAWRTSREAHQLRRIQEMINLQNRAEAAQAAETAEQSQRRSASQSSAPMLRETAQRNAELSRQLSELVIRIERASSRQERIAAQLDAINKGYHSTRQQLDIAGLNEALGTVLRRERRALPDVYEYQRANRERAEHIADARLAQFQFDQQRRELSPVPQQLEPLLAQLDGALSEPERETIKQELSRLLNDHNTLVDRLASNYGRYVDQLADLNRDQSRLVEQAQQYGALLDESLFWIASASAVGLEWPRELASSLAWLATPEQWRKVGATAATALREAPLLSALALLAFAVLVRIRRDIRARLQATAGRVGKVHSDRFALTLEALLLTPLLALPWPLLLYTLGWLLTQPLSAENFAVGVGLSLQAVAIVGFVIESFRQLCRPYGLAEAHFGWNAQSRTVLRRNLTWLLAVSLPTTFLITLTEWQLDEQHRDTLGRLAFVAGSLALALFARRALHPQNGALTALRNPAASGLWWWLRYLGYPLVVAAPVVLVAMALYGYHYTALQLQSRFFTSGWLLVGAGIALNLAVRWIKVAERRLALSRARARREAARSDRSKDSLEPGVEMRIDPDEAEIDLETVDDQTRGLMHLATAFAVAAGLWLIWGDLVPAVNILNEMVLWRYAGDEGETTAISLVNLIMAGTVLMFTLMAAKNIPGVLEISILPRLAMDQGNRYAVTTLSRYFIVSVGLIITLTLLGLSWGKAQWLIAALGLGLGFGLQEIFANFVSGLIILFERPIRLGDTVTVGEYSGTVTRIRIRATTITDWEQREIIIPNKTFITDRLINWTLSDPTTRLLINVQVSYDADPERARELILDVAQNNERVLADPEPSVFLVGFGDSALSFELRAFVRDLGDRLPLTHELHLGIVRTLREHGIEIPYPQRDLRIRSIAPDVQLPVPTPGNEKPPGAT